MNKKYFRISTLTAAVMAGAMMVTPVFAEGTGAAGGTTSFTKTITVTAGAASPNVEYTYAVTAGSPIAATGSNLRVFAGIGTPTVSKATFTSADTVTGNKVSQTVTINFTGINFTEPGVYRYIITENGGIDGVITEAEDRVFACDVYVEYNDANVLTVGGYVLHSDENAVPNGTDTSLAKKITGLEASYATNDLTISKSVKGNQGIRDEYFPFTVTLTGAMANTDYFIDGVVEAVPETAFNAATANPTKITTDGTGSGSATIWLKDGQSVSIKNLKNGAGYTVVEAENASDKGYTTSIVTTGDKTNVAENDIATVNGKTIEDASLSEATTVAYTNTKGGVVPTGLFMTIGGAAAITLIGGAGAVIMMRKKKDDEE